MPSWDDDDTLTTDPQREVSLIYYANKRAWKTASSASRPSAPARRSRIPATATRSNLEVLRDENSVKLRFNWTTTASATTSSTPTSASPVHPRHVRPEAVIKKKYVVLKNDYIHHVLDIYHI
jgi:benzoate/toluate 1,2-dioxygenase beta subunit